MSRVVCPWDLITSFVIDAFKGYGVPVDGMFGTNPLTIGIPTDEDFDFTWRNYGRVFFTYA